MRKPPRTKMPQPPEVVDSAKLRKPLPHRFVLDALAELEPATRAMFGALAVYVGDRIIFILRDRPDEHAANGVWVAVSPEHEQSLRADFSDATRVQIMGKDINGWLLLPTRSVNFEESVLRACGMVLGRDARIGKVPERNRRRQVG